MVVGVREGWSGSGSGAWLGGLLGSCASTSMYGWPLGGLGWAGRCRVAPWVRGDLWDAVGAGGGGVLRWGLLAFWGALVVSWRPADGDGGACVMRGVG